MSYLIEDRYLPPFSIFFPTLTRFDQIFGHYKDVELSCFGHGIDSISTDFNSTRNNIDYRL